MGQVMLPLQLQQTLKVMRLIPLDAKPLYQMKYHIVIISLHLFPAISLRPKVACDAKPGSIRNRNAGRIVLHPLRNDDMNLQPLLFLALKMHKAAHGMEQAPGDGNPQPQPAHIAPTP